MMQLPLAEVIRKIKEHSSLSEGDIEAKIAEKMEKLAGLISKEGAAHIIANELGIKLFEAGKLKIKDVLSGMRNVEVDGKVMQVFPLTNFSRKDGSQGTVTSFILGDESSSIRVAAWGAHAEQAASLTPGAVIKIKKGYARDNSGRREIHLNEQSEIVKNPPGVSIQASIGEMRKPIRELQENDANVSVLGTVVQVLDPRYYEVCPTCGSRVVLKEQQYECGSHGAVQPEYAVVVSVVVDDGTETIRAVCFRQQAEQLLQEDKAKVLAYKEDAAAFEAARQRLLGEIIKVTGRVKRNAMFDRLEFMAQTVFPRIDPDEEMKRLQQ
ncbi:hypothetical protein HY491_00475 [Candidatus Woesearchaeota archaeon]|nr:hypothetical protein [Candidatus Woesearchaeota archaeon]